MNYEELEYLVDGYYSEYQTYGNRDRYFEQATAWLYEGIDERLRDEDMVELIRDIKNGPFQDATWTAYSILDNLLQAFLMEL